MKPKFGAIGAPFWKTCVVVGTGPSLAGFDFNRLRGHGPVLAVKEAYHDLPFASACFGLDLPWMKWGHAALEALVSRMPVVLAVPDQEINHLEVRGASYVRRGRKCDGFSDDPGLIEAGSNSGFGAVNLAYLKQAKHIVLFGYDYGGRHYCQDRYQTRPEDLNARYLPRWATNFRCVLPQLKAAGVEVLNASPDSAVDAFPKVTHDEALQYLDRLRSA